MSNTLLVRPMRPLSSSITGSLRCGAVSSTTTTSATKPSTPAASPSPMGLTQRRHESTTRRQLNRLRSVPTAPSFTPSSGHTTDHIVFNPPSSAPSVYHTPLKFLPAGDRRRELYALTSRLASTPSNTSPIARTGTANAAASSSSPSILPPHLAHASATSNAPLPSPVRQPYAKKYHLTETDIAEIRRLRASDPAQWTRERLAAKFECSQFFVGLVAPAPEHAARKAAEVEEVKRGWGRRKREAREDRGRRREAWGRDA
ncbi:mitochondrial ribosomal protein subunit L20-domain-containing protein [Macrophomina phaseolina]|uniref:Mitochondrial ribosomal protein subunit L20-domain-containing protein n=1 Tax=Macrophomina phaseolina TaxID=35725 RepID=A0ABQ8GDR3_9PEZI|nr:mitochondrial ribosomal protein subunit L20-domain-containing protein [Macrophomina phaseolina]